MLQSRRPGRLTLSNFPEFPRPPLGKHFGKFRIRTAVLTDSNTSTAQYGLEPPYLHWVSASGATLSTRHTGRGETPAGRSFLFLFCCCLFHRPRGRAGRPAGRAAAGGRGGGPSRTKDLRQSPRVGLPEAPGGHLEPTRAAGKSPILRLGEFATKPVA